MITKLASHIVKSTFCNVELSVSGVGVIDKAALVLGAVEDGGASLNELVERTGLSRATAHRLASALEVHGLLRRSHDARFALGPRLVTLGEAAAAGWPLAEAARPALSALRDTTGESAQLFVRQGDARVCLASLQSPHGLRTIVAAGAILPLDQGSGGRVLLGTDYGAWVATVEEREAGVASVSAPLPLPRRSMINPSMLFACSSLTNLATSRVVLR